MEMIRYQWHILENLDSQSPQAENNLNIFSIESSSAVSTFLIQKLIEENTLLVWENFELKKLEISIGEYFLWIFRTIRVLMQRL